MNHLRRFLLFLLAFAMLLPAAAFAEETHTAPEGALPASYQAPAETETYLYHLYDGDPFTTLTLKRNETLTMQIPADATRLYFDFYEPGSSYTLDLLDADNKRISSEKGSSSVGFLIVPLDGTAVSARLTCDSKTLVLSDWFACTDAYEPPFPDTDPEADVLVILNTPGDELFKLGGVLPLLCGEHGLSAQVVYFTAVDGYHMHQCMQVLRAMGVRRAPVFGTGSPSKEPYDKAVFGRLGTSESEMLKMLVDRIRTLRPKLVLTLDTAKEQPVYADGTIARTVRTAVSYAAQSSRYPSSKAHKVLKFYTLSENGGTAIDQTVPLNAYDGKTGVALGKELYGFYREELLYRRTIPETVRFTLESGAVGADTACDDLLENLSPDEFPGYRETTPAPSATPEPTEEPTPEPTEEPTAEPVGQTSETPAPETPAPVEEPTPAVPATSAPEAPAPELRTVTTKTALWWLPAAIGAAIALALLFALSRLKLPVRLLWILPLLAGIALSVLAFTGILFAKTETIVIEPEPAAAASPAPATPEEDVIVHSADTATPAPTEMPTLPPTEAPTPTPEPTPEPTPTPDPAAEFFLEGDGEEFESDFENGHWWYKNNALSIDIREVHMTMSDGHPLVYYVADIRMRDYSSYRSGVREYVQPWVYARMEKAVLAITGDNLVSAEKEEKGCLIRQGKFYCNSGHSETLSVNEDLTLTVYARGQAPERVLMDHGVRDTYGFGPTLVENGRIHESTRKNRVSHVNPRIGIGMIEPGHWIAIATEGRQGRDRGNFSYSISLEYFAQMFIDYNCTVAYNMDGGSSVGIVFMGEALNRHYKRGTDDMQRPWNDALLFGYSEQLPSVDTPTTHDGYRHDF